MPSEADPLLELTRRLRAGIPSLSSLKSQLTGWEDYLAFARLVREFLPERERDILSCPTPEEQVAAFATYFEDRYFPLDEALKQDDWLSYADLLYTIPVVLRGISYEDYNSISADGRPGIQLMSYLVADPYEGEERNALAEACLSYVPRELLQRVPEEGLQPMKLHQLLDETKYKGLAWWADIIWKETGNFFLDNDYEELHSYMYPYWDKDTVEGLARHWAQANVIEEEIMSLARWLEEDPPTRFEELLNFILKERR